MLNFLVLDVFIISENYVVFHVNLLEKWNVPIVPHGVVIIVMELKLEGSPAVSLALPKQRFPRV